MRYPNLRYGNPTEFRHYAHGIPTKDLARTLRRSERTVRDWISEKQRVPWWVPELLRLRDMDRIQQMRHMGIAPTMRRFGIVSGELVRFPVRKSPQPVNDYLAPTADTPVKSLRHG